MAKTQNEINPYTQEELNPEIEVVDYDGEITRVEYLEDHLIKTGVYDHRIGHGVWRLNGMLSYDEWKAVRKYFKDYHQGWFKWGTAKPDLVISILTQLRRPEVKRVVVRHKMTAEGVIALKENGGNLQCGLTGKWLIPKEEE